MNLIDNPGIRPYRGVRVLCAVRFAPFNAVPA